MEWISTDNDYPDWKDAGRAIEVDESKNGYSYKVTGVLEIEDFQHDGEGTEYPIWRVRVTQDKTVPFGDVDRYRFLT